MQVTISPNPQRVRTLRVRDFPSETFFNLVLPNNEKTLCIKINVKPYGNVLWLPEKKTTARIKSKVGKGTPTYGNCVAEPLPKGTSVSFTA